eukprot:CAMPEP_0202695564 /NCGR_PEP_ID=MMETSP1385-20130828/9136_1 /ASSEMBLY_ACC=CAM_ASM_000861 /TAXON_ID=933848 /ORGANISM="Elphidium margaritaceum" /LENGTH=351 /DNA_ID=CAMNT_0049351619 /DNA_START=25 /DNA_END=1077 /DNA_ORIENTATION=+
MAPASSLKIASAFLLLIVYYIFTSFFIDDSLLTSTSGIEPVRLQLIDYDVILDQQYDFNEAHSQWRPYNHYAAIPHFYTKKGTMDNPDTITICTICDIKLIYEARLIVSNYQSGPISLAVFIDGNYRFVATDKLYQLIDAYFLDIPHLFDITVGIVAINFSSPFYVDMTIDREFTADTPLALTIPTNVLRNLAESQVNTQWLFNIDIDFWFLSSTFHDTSSMTALLRAMNAIVTQYGVHVLFVVPAFEVISQTANQSLFTHLSKQQLLGFVYLDDIAPFHADMNAQKCTAYDVWYDASQPYRLDYSPCHYAYEPWYIMHRNMSVATQYQWDNAFVGRGLNKVERVYRLRSE